MYVPMQSAGNVKFHSGVVDYASVVVLLIRLAATLRWFTAGGAIRIIAVRQLSQTWKEITSL